MPLPLPHPAPSPISRRNALIASLSLLTLHTAHAANNKKLPEQSPQALAVPGGIARLDLGPAAIRPVAYLGDLPLLVLGDASRWTFRVDMGHSWEDYVFGLERLPCCLACIRSPV